MSLSAQHQCLLLPELMAMAADWIISHSPLIFIVSSFYCHVYGL